MFHNISASATNPSTFSEQDATQRTSSPPGASQNPASASLQNTRSEHSIYQSRGPSPLQQQVANQVPQVASLHPGSPDKPFQTLKLAAQATLQKLLTKHPSERTLNQAKKYAYLIYAYYPHRIKDVDRLASQRAPEENKSRIDELCHLAEAHSGAVEIISQNYYQLRREVSLQDAVSFAENDPSPEKAMGKIFSGNYVIVPSDWKEQAATEEDPIDSRLSINVKPEYANQLAEIFFDLCKNKEAGISQFKLFGPKVWGIRSETGVIYLSEASFEKAVRISELVHDALIKKLGREISPSDLYGSVPPGTEEIKSGIAYSEKSPSSAQDESSGQAKANIIAAAVIEHLETNKDLDLALKEHLEKNGYSTTNPAFVVRPGENTESV